MKLAFAKLPLGAIPPLPRPARLMTSAFLGLILAALAIAVAPRGGQTPSGAGLTVHEWGTFTAISGADGQPVQWLPVDLAGKSELPTFVQHFRGTPKDVLRGTIRMETPVIYFYSSQEADVSVHVSFSKGFITEWYPHATQLSPSGLFSTEARYAPHDDGSITWDSVSVAANPAPIFPRETSASRYYAARETSATPISVQTSTGRQYEKFLFYRGVSTVPLHLSAKVLPSGSVIVVNLVGQSIPSLIVFERRGDKLGYHIVTTLQDRAVLETPAASSTLDSLRGDLKNILVWQGLFRDEAHAMLETWGDSWFEEGSRLIYIVPRQYVDSILPLSISPSPAKLSRVFVGRIELVTPATENSIQAAIASHDGATLRKYGRFLHPIFDVILAKHSDPATEDHLWEELGASLAATSETH